MSRTVGLDPKHVFGLRTDVVGNVHFTTDQEIIFPAAGVLVFQDFVTNKQKFLRFPEDTKPEIIIISPNRKLLVVSEHNLEREETFINIYDLESLKKLKSLTLPPECPVQRVGSMCFTCDSKGFAVLSQEPDSFLTIYKFNNTKVTGRASNMKFQGCVTLVQCNPGDSSIVAVGGEKMLRIMTKRAGEFHQLGDIRNSEKFFVTSLTWLSPELLVAATADMELYFVEGTEIKAKYKAMDVELIDLLAETPESDDASRSELSSIDTQFTQILCLTAFPTGLAFATNNIVHMFEKETPDKFFKKSVLTIPVTIFDESLYVIKNIAINEQQDTIIATTQHSQIYIGMLIAPETIRCSQIEFKYLGEPLHIDSIIDMSVCSWKTIAITAAKDRTLRVWNYKTMKLELVKKFFVDIRVVALHPSGMFAAVGFFDVIRLVQIQLKDLKTTKSFNFPMCSVLQFSNRGHFLAVGCEKEIVILSVFTFEAVMSLKGHKGVLSLAWSTDDEYLVSSGLEGSVYEWNISRGGQRVNEFIEKGTLHKSVAVSSDQSYIVGATHSGCLREIRKSQLVREFLAPHVDASFTAIELSRSNQALFAANNRGCLYNVQMPLHASDGSACFTNYRFYHKAINRLSITNDGEMLITAGDDGTLVFWKITGIKNPYSLTR